MLHHLATRRGGGWSSKKEVIEVMHCVNDNMVAVSEDPQKSFSKLIEKKRCRSESKGEAGVDIKGIPPM